MERLGIQHEYTGKVGGRGKQQVWAEVESRWKQQMGAEVDLQERTNLQEATSLVGILEARAGEGGHSRAFTEPSSKEEAITQM
jgi:hypothetical protein